MGVDVGLAGIVRKMDNDPKFAVLVFISAYRTKKKTAVSEITVETLQEAERVLLRQPQGRTFSEDLSALRSGRPLSKSIIYRVGSFLSV